MASGYGIKGGKITPARAGQLAVGKGALLTFLQMLAGYVHFVALPPNGLAGDERNGRGSWESFEWVMEDIGSSGWRSREGSRTLLRANPSLQIAPTHISMLPASNPPFPSYPLLRPRPRHPRASLPTKR
jgi:hypothetical protein